MKKTILISVLFFTQLFSLCYAQNFDFEVLEAYKIDELPLSRKTEASILIEKQSLQDGKVFLIVTGVLKNEPSNKISLKTEDIVLGLDNKIKPIGFISFSSLPEYNERISVSYRWPNNYFSAIFVVEKNIEKSSISIKEKEFSINSINSKKEFVISHPKVKVLNTTYLSELKFDQKYKKIDNEYVQTFSPIRGKILQIDIELTAPTKRFNGDKNPFVLQPEYLCLIDDNGSTYTCIGSKGFGSLKTFPINYQRDSDKIYTESFYFVVPKESSFKLFHLNQVVAEF